MSMFRYEEQRQIKVEVVEKSPEAPQKSQEAGQKSDSGDKSIVKITKASADDKPASDEKMETKNHRSQITDNKDQQSQPEVWKPAQTTKGRRVHLRRVQER